MFSSLLGVLIVVLLVTTSFVSSLPSSSSIIRSQFLQKPSHNSPSVILEHFHNLLGPSLCFTEKDSFSLIQLCLNHGFRRVELERLRNYVVSGKHEPFSLVELDLSDQKEEQEEPYDPDSIFSLHKQFPARKDLKVLKSFSREEDDTSRKVFARKPISSYLKQELEDYFTAVTFDSDPEMLDAAFSHEYHQSPHGSPFFSAKPSFKHHSKNNKKLSALANISSEIYGRYDPKSSKLKFSALGGEAEIIYPNGDACHNHHEMRETTWTTHLKFVCSMSSIGSRRGMRSVLSSKNHNAEEESIKWDVRVNAPQCMVIVMVFTDVLC